MKPRRRLLGGLSVGLSAAAFALVGCGQEDPDEAYREGLTAHVDGIGYTVFLSRQLNTRIPPDRAYFDVDPAPVGSTHFGVFLEACNEEGLPSETVKGFAIEDNAGNTYRRIELPPTNPFGYHAQRLAREECIPEAGSVAALGATGGALLLFELPLEAVENRPLVLEIGTRLPADEREHVELDL